ncbi:hypothetical protein [Streptomyces sp. VRA16 Mangrove soil]|uniref:hypothetical protein n=1 Tax=Streptomyces sp. VRA16 Mangrove soil TaxID=2817434 RepID=UPI001A9D2F58|nr:hypothetical protein [Streptomyces sp. VRA16 Mangrove soil]MBO1333275.1 hypothetical protein [Streptomyces sp. VRA16 Mangrove soil]
MSRRKTIGSGKRLALTAAAAVLAGGGAFALAATGNAAQPSTVCDGLATALANNQKFIDGQRAAPDAQSAARIANREAVIAEIQRKQAASGCGGESSASGAGGGSSASSAGGDSSAGAAAPSAAGTAAATGDPATTTGTPAAVGDQVCPGSTVTLSGEGGAPAASSDQFPAGTKLKVTNLDNNKSATVEVTSVSGSCVLLNDAAFEQVREPGKFLIRRALIEKVG